MSNEELEKKIIEFVEVKKNCLVILQPPNGIRGCDELSDGIKYLEKDLERIFNTHNITFMAIPDIIKITVVPPGSKTEIQNE